MNTVLRGKLVACWACNTYGMSMFRMHQNEYPGIEGEVRTPAEACSRLIEILVQAIGYAEATKEGSP